MNKMTILIADAHKLVRQCLSDLLNADQRFKVVAETGCGKNTVALFNTLQPDILILDTKIDNQDYKEVIKTVLITSPGARIICLSSKNESGIAKQIFEIGAKGFISKYASRYELIEAINEVFTGNRYICREIKSDFINQLLNTNSKEEKYYSLTKRERDIISLINKGCSSKEIACILNLSAKTVDVHRCNIFKKLNIKKATALVNYTKYKVSA